MQTIDFINKAKLIHGNKYDYSIVNYKNNSTPVTIICATHGEFKQRPHGHLCGNGCPKCHQNNISNQKLFIAKATSIHNNRYDYSDVSYINSYTKVTIICKKHGPFTQLPSDHLRYKGCPQCSFDRLKLSKEQFIHRASELYHGKYDYSLVEYKNFTTKIIIICPEHGPFTQLPYNHLRGKKCPQCASTQTGIVQRSTTEQFIEKATSIHHNKYDYSQVEYIKALDKVKIICPNHGVFSQTPNCHLNGEGCPNCVPTVSKAHYNIAEYVKNWTDITINDRTIIAPLELDIVIPSKKLAIEHHGLWYHSYDSPETTEQKYRHFNKYAACTKAGYRLIQIFEHEWNDNKELIQSKIAYLFGQTNKVYARNCKLCELTTNEYNEFMDNNHIQKTIHSSIRYGLRLDNTLVCAMGFRRSNKYDFELARFANKAGYTVVGGASKLLNKFSSNNKGKSLLSYADIRYSDGNLYRKLGFEFNGFTKPGYFYCKGNKVFNRRHFQKHKLAGKLANYNNLLSESQNMFNNGYRRIWDAGHFIFTKTL